MRADRYKTEQTRKPKRKKSRILKVLLLLILMLLRAIPSTVYYLYKDAKDSLYVNISDNDISFEVGEKVLATDCISDYSGNLFFDSGESSYSVFEAHDPVSYDDFYLDSDEAGEYTINGFVEQPIIGGYLAPYKTFSFSYTVTDNTPPLMIWSGDGAVVIKGEPFDIKSVIAYGDNADPDPKVEYEGDVDTDTVGSYPLHVTVSDASGNSIDWDFTVNVAESAPAYSDDSTPYNFSDFVKSNAGDGRHFGIDVSSWQGDIDFEAVKKAGCEFAIIRIGYSHDGEVTMDDKFEQNLERAKTAGIPVGLYMYSYDNTEEEVRSAAQWIVSQLGGEALELPVAFDWEDFGVFQTYEMSFIGLNRLYDAFADELEAAGYDAMLYGSKTYLEKIWANTYTRPVWLAHYTDNTDYASPYRIWQASSSGRIDGIAGAVDMDIMYD